MDRIDLFIRDDNNNVVNTKNTRYYYTRVTSFKSEKFPIYVTFEKQLISFYFHGAIVERNTTSHQFIFDKTDVTISTNISEILKKADIKRKLELIGFKFSINEDGNNSIIEMPNLFISDESGLVNNKKITGLFQDLNNILQSKNDDVTKIDSIIDDFLSYDMLPTTKLFSLDLGVYDDAIQRLEKELVDIFDDEFPLLENYKLPLNYINIPFLTYNNLQEFEKEFKEQNRINLMVIFLDFIFCLEYSTVFQDNPFYKEIKHRMSKSLLLQSIRKKAQFYYNLNRFIEKEKYPYADFANNTFTDLFIQSESDWLSLLRKPNISNIINKDNKWFDNVEDETKKLIQSVNKNVKIKNDSKATNIPYKNSEKFYNNHLNEKTKTVGWFIERNNILRAWLTFDKMQYIFWILFFLISYFILQIFCQINECVVFDKTIELNNSGILMYIVFGIIGLGIILNVITMPKVSVVFKNIFPKKIKEILPKKKLFKKENRISIVNRIRSMFFLTVKMWMLPLWFLIIGSSLLTFEITTYFNKYFILNNWSYQFGIMFLFLLLNIFFYKSFKYKFLNQERAFYISSRANDIKLFAFLILLIISFFLTIKIIINFIKFPIQINWLSFFVVLMILAFNFSLYEFSKRCLLNRESKFTNKNAELCLFLFSFFTGFASFLYVFQYLGSLLPILIFIAYLSLVYVILYNNEKELHTKLSVDTSRNKTWSMLFYGLVISFIVNFFLFNIKYKEYLETYEYTGNIWHHTTMLNNQETASRNEEYSYRYKGSEINLNKIEEISKKPLSDSILVEIDDKLYNELTNVYVYKKNQKLFPILKEIDINGFHFFTLPSVLYINTLLTMLIAVLLQILIHNRRFFKGGEAE